jgi:hypothetical protein
MHLINDIKRLDKGSFIKSLVINIIKAGITLLFILRHSTCTFKGLLNGNKGKKVNFMLLNIAIIKDFFINIVLKAFLYKKGL